MNDSKSAVLFIIFNRYDTAVRVFEAIRAYRPERLYVAADGPRDGNEADLDKCQAVRTFVEESVDWPCEVKKLFRTENLGCKLAVSGSISWFFEHEEEGIILEDDCLPGGDFFGFCQVLLEKYRHDPRIVHIGGTNLQFGNWRNAASYYFSNIPSIWGWAGWRRSWARYDLNMTHFEEFEQEKLMRFVFPDNHTAHWATAAARAAYEGKIDTWDYQLAFSVLINHGLCITPNMNLVSNIGFQHDARLTANPNDIHANIPVEELGEMRHPNIFIPNVEADLFQLSHSIPKPVASQNGDAATSFIGKAKASVKKLLKG